MTGWLALPRRPHLHTSRLRGGKYLTGQPATFEEGDWNGDGVFDQKDLVSALQAGSYLRNQHAGLGLSASSAPWRAVDRIRGAAFAGTAAFTDSVY